MNELELFAAAMGLADPAARAALLDEKCVGAPALRDKMEGLLAVHFRSRGPATTTPAASMAPESPQNSTGAYVPKVGPGALIAGRYKLLQPIGEGGMGTVWMAEQTEPVKRRVAVKLIRAERGTSTMLLARFEAERQAIALMDHPNIARLFEAGTTADGSPYFVMELVKGVPLNEYCDAHRLTVPKRLNLFMQICSAVQHAHQKGIIHRDLKPSNLLVESHDGRLVPKVIDFGLAKATTGLQLTEQTLFTAFGSVLGTPLYMAPEQANFNAIDVDTRADIYALGVILYELLTGTTPIARETLKQVALDDLLRLVREQEAPAPSSRLSSSAAIPHVAANRQTEPAKLGRLVKGELDWIVMKALAKERERRYETASGFAKDIERFLNQEPVLAGPPSQSYRLRKFVQRHQGRVLAAAVVLLTLLVGIAGTTWGLWRAERQRSLAEEAARAEREAKDEALQNLEFARKGYRALGNVFAKLDPKQDYASIAEFRGALKANLEEVAKQLAEAALNDPLTVADIQFILALSLQGMGEPIKAIDALRQSYDALVQRRGPGHEETLYRQRALARCYQAAGKTDQALSLYAEALKLSKTSLGPEHPDTLTSMHDLAAGYYDARKYDLALPLLEQTLEARARIHGPSHSVTRATKTSLALCLQRVGKFEQAIPHFEDNLERARLEGGETHPHTLTAKNNLALAYLGAKRFNLGLPLLEEVLKVQKEKLGDDHPTTISSLNNLAWGLQASGRPDLALPVIEQAAQAVVRRGFQLEVADKVIPQAITAFAEANQNDKAEALLRPWLTHVKATLGEQSPTYSRELLGWASLLLKQRRWRDAEPVLRECLALREKHQPDDWTTFNTRSLLGGALLGQKRYSEAEPLLLKGYQGMVQREQTIPPLSRVRLPEGVDRLIQLYTETQRPDEAKKWQVELGKYPAAD